MNKLDSENLYLLLDEPIYVLDKHFDVKESQANDDVSDQKENKMRSGGGKGILIINEEEGEDIILQEDEKFLFKGLNALEITSEDVTLISSNEASATVNSLPHSKRIIFSSNQEDTTLYTPSEINGIVYLVCHQLSQIRRNQELKVRFWNGLKSLIKK